MSTQFWHKALVAQARARVIAALLRRFGDIDLAEDAFAEACLRAVQTWTPTQTPENPTAWLLTVSRNCAVDALRKKRLMSDQELPDVEAPDTDETLLYRDNVLRLLFICCHPDLTPQDQAAIALRIVLGLSVPEIARAFLVPAKTMERRIGRAKIKITQSEVPFDTPGLTERSRRLNSVMLMIYLMFNEGWSASAGDNQISPRLCREALRLVALLDELFTAHAEIRGMRALFMANIARLPARIGADQRPISLDDQDRSLWDHAMIAEADQLLQKTLRGGQAGPYQIKAALALTHARAQGPEDTDWAEIERLYQALTLFEPTPVVALNLAVATGMRQGPAAGLVLLEPLAEPLREYRWFHTTRAGMLMELGRYDCAHGALAVALTLNPTQGETASIQGKLAECDERRKI